MNATDNPESHYLSYMLRMWLKTDSNGKPRWCASLEEPSSHHIDSFGDIVSLFAFLRGLLDVKDLYSNVEEQVEQRTHEE